MSDADKYAQYVDCFFCGSRTQFGPNIYRAHKVVEYDLMVCRMCTEINHDGLTLDDEEKLLKHLEDKGLGKPSRLKNGRLPLPRHGQRVEMSK